MVTQDEHQQCVVALAAKAHRLAGNEHRDQLAFHRALEGDVLQPLGPRSSAASHARRNSSVPAARRRAVPFFCMVS